MLKIISKTLLCTAVIAMVALFAATQAGADECTASQPECTQDELNNFTCGDSADYRVRIVPGLNGEFPEIIGGNSRFTYDICETGSRNISNVSIAFSNSTDPPIEILDSEPKCLDGMSTDPCRFPYDPATKLAIGQTLADAWKWVMGDTYKNGGKIWVEVAGKVGAEDVPMVGKIGNKPRDWMQIQILGPGGDVQPGVQPRVVADEECISFFEIESETYPGMIEAISAKAKRDFADCIKEESLEFYKSSDCSGSVTPHFFDPPAADFFLSSGNFGGCSELAEVTKTSPACVTLTLSSGRKSKVCW
jgi:hypothetical protein